MLQKKTKKQNEIKIIDDKGDLLMVDDDDSILMEAASNRNSMHHCLSLNSINNNQQQNQEENNKPKRRQLDSSKLSLLIQNTDASAQFLTPSVFSSSASPSDDQFGDEEITMAYAAATKAYRSNSCSNYFNYDFKIGLSINHYS